MLNIEAHRSRVSTRTAAFEMATPKPLEITAKHIFVVAV
jgi:hypothetical protein